MPNTLVLTSLVTTDTTTGVDSDMFYEIIKTPDVSAANVLSCEVLPSL